MHVHDTELHWIEQARTALPPGVAGDKEAVTRRVQRIEVGLQGGRLQRVDLEVSSRQRPWPSSQYSTTQWSTNSPGMK